MSPPSLPLASENANVLLLMPDIVLTTLNAKYIHSAFGLRYLMANLGPLKDSARIVEFDINQRPVDIVERLLACEPKVVGVGVYVWNVSPTTEVVALLKRLRPELVIVLGGPEVSYEYEEQAIVREADYLITGEADLAFAALAAELMAGRRPEQKVWAPEPPEFSKLILPYSYYTADDIAHRLLYVEASRGCPYHCEFCLSSLEVPVRQAPLTSFLTEIQHLLDRGARHLKFVDRTFNLNLDVSSAVLEFLLARYEPGMFFHFEAVPDRLPEGLRQLICRFPPGALQFEVGIQTFNPEVAERIHRRQNYERAEENLGFLRHETGVHMHADLIAGLPGETLESFAAGFDRLLSFGPHEIQVGILKRLRGTSIGRHDAEWQMCYSPYPPYEILSNKLLDFPTLQRIRRFARYWDLVANSGHFLNTAPLLWRGQSPFQAFMSWSDWLFGRVGRTDSIALVRLMRLLFEYLTSVLGTAPSATAEALWADYQQGGHYDKPEFLKEFLPAGRPAPADEPRDSAMPKRQARHRLKGNRNSASSSPCAEANPS